MMASLFLIFTLAILLVIKGLRNAAIAVAVAGVILSLVMFWHHATDFLKINL